MAHLSYGLALKDEKDFKSPFAFDAYDLWFGSDFDLVLSELLDDFLDDIETDISSVDSSNLSEQHSAQISAQSSADRQALIDAGISLDGDDTSLTSAGGAEESRVSTPTTNGDGSTTSSESTDTDEEVSTTTLDHSHSNHGGYHENSESRYSGRSQSDEDDSGLSDSEGTSQRTGEASTLSSVSIEVK